jgi:hypothetical protein
MLVRVRVMFMQGATKSGSRGVLAHMYGLAVRRTGFFVDRLDMALASIHPGSRWSIAPSRVMDISAHDLVVPFPHNQDP